MKRTPLKDRTLPDYTRGEENFNMISHAVGALLGVAALVLCVVFSAIRSDAWAVVSGAIYGVSLITLFTISGVYHGLRPEKPKKVMQVIDHCTIFFLICGSYTPVLLAGVRRVAPVQAWVLFGLVWGVSAFGCVFTAIDHARYGVLAMICYLVVGWSIVFELPALKQAITLPGVVWLLSGGVLYTLGSVLYGIGSKVRYMHSVFHLFVLAGSITHFFCIFFYVL